MIINHDAIWTLGHSCLDITDLLQDITDLLQDITGLLQQVSVFIINLTLRRLSAYIPCSPWGKKKEVFTHGGQARKPVFQVFPKSQFCVGCKKRFYKLFTQQLLTLLSHTYHSSKCSLATYQIWELVI